MQRLTTLLIVDIADTRGIDKKGEFLYRTGKPISFSCNCPDPRKDNKQFAAVLFDILNRKSTIDRPAIHAEKNGACLTANEIC